VTHSLVDAVARWPSRPRSAWSSTPATSRSTSRRWTASSFDLHTFAEYGKRGVLALLQDSTNVERSGYTPSESAVIPRLDEIFSRTKKKLFFSCFSSSDLPHPHRSRTGPAHKRKVAIVGRSMMESTEIAQDLGYIDVPQGLIINPGQMRDYPPEQLMVLISGTQGEPMSALSRAAVDNHKHAHIEAGDTVVLSSRIIPGNEKSIFRVIDHLYRRDANVIYDNGSNGLIHVSGHGSQEEMRLLINLVRPKFFIPVHGNYGNLRKHAQMAMETGAVEHAIVIEDGDVLELDKNDARKKDKVTTGRILIDSGSSIDVVEELVLRDRRILSEDGVVLAVLAINKRTGKVEQQPEVVMRGFGGADITEQARELVLKTLDGLTAEQKSDYGMVKEKVRSELKRLIQKTTGRRPMIMPVIHGDLSFKPNSLRRAY
jgi:ribonuclease J